MSGIFVTFLTMMRQVTIPQTDDMSDDNSECQPDQQVEHQAPE